MEFTETEIVTDPVRLSFPALFEPKPVSRSKDAAIKYQAALLFPRDYDMTPVIDCIKAAMMDKWGKLIKISGRRNPLKKCEDRDPEKKPLAGYDDGWTVLNAKSDYQPSVLDQKKQEILDPERIFAGCWCRFHLNAYAWEHEDGGKGVSFGLNAVQLVREDTRLGGRKDSRDIFGEIEVEDVGVGENDIVGNSAGMDDLLG